MGVFSIERHNMVDRQIAQRGLHDPMLLSAFEEVPRHLFVPENSWYAAYDDAPLPIGLGQTISQPYIVALMTSLLQLTGDECVLEVGTGSGYQAAILSRLAAEVHTIEFLPELAVRAETLLKELAYSNVHVHVGDGSLGWPEAAPYPAIIVTASSPKVPDPLREQLSEGGRLVLPVVSHSVQLLKVLIRRGDEFIEEVIASVAFVPLRGKFGYK